MWTCRACTLINTVSATRCVACLAPCTKRQVQVVDLVDSDTDPCVGSCVDTSDQQDHTSSMDAHPHLTSSAIAQCTTARDESTQHTSASDTLTTSASSGLPTSTSCIPQTNASSIANTNTLATSSSRTSSSTSHTSSSTSHTSSSTPHTSSSTPHTSRHHHTDTPRPLVQDILVPLRTPTQTHTQHLVNTPVTHRHDGTNWTCGYSNLLVLLTSVLHVSPFADRVKAELGVRLDELNVRQGGMGVPLDELNVRQGGMDVRTVQVLLKRAWDRGFDPEGAAHFRGRIVGTKEWLGATDVAAMLRSLRLRAKVVDFERVPVRASTIDTNPLLWFIWQYFTAGLDDVLANVALKWGTAVVEPHPRRRSLRDLWGGQQVPLFPLYLQHQGHSRTIAGVRRSSSGFCEVLVLDPAVPTARVRSALSTPQKQKKVWKPAASFAKHKQYQLVYIDPVPTALTDTDLDAWKRMTAAIKFL